MRYFKKFSKLFKFVNVRFGKNNSGRIVTRFKKKKKFKNKKVNLLINRVTFKNYGILLNIFKYKNFSSFVGLVKYTNGSYSYLKIMHGCFIGQIFQSISLPIRFLSFYLPGNLLPLKFIKQNLVFSNLFINKKFKYQYCTASGTYARFLQNYLELNLVLIKLPSGKFKKIFGDNFAILGRNSNVFFNQQVIGKAGNNFNIGKKPNVRGVAMNAVDHPNGGRTKSNSPELSVWGWIAKFNR